MGMTQDGQSVIRTASGRESATAPENTDPGDAVLLGAYSMPSKRVTDPAARPV